MERGPAQPFGAYPYPPLPSAGQHFELRPDRATFWRGVGARGLILLPLIGFGVFNAVRRNGIGWTVVLYVGIVAVLLVGVWLMFQTSRVTLTGSTVVRHRLFLPPTVIDRARVIGAVLVPQYTTIYDRTAPLLLLLNRQGRPLLRLTGQVFDAPDLFTFAERYGLAGFEVISGEVGPKVVGARHRKALSLIERRPLLVVLLGTFVLLVLVVIGVSIFDPVND